MSDKKVVEISKIIGQIEDELNGIKSAKNQVEAVIGSNVALSESLQALFDSADNIIKVLDNNAFKIIEDITNKVQTLNIKAIEIDNFAKLGVSKISEQSTSTQAKLEKDFSNLVQQVMDKISNSTNHSLEMVQTELVKYNLLVNDVAKSFTSSTSDVLLKQESQITEIAKLFDCIQDYTKQSISKINEQSSSIHVKLKEELNNFELQLMNSIFSYTDQSLKSIETEITRYNLLINDTAKWFTDSTFEVMAKQEVQIAEITTLIASIEEKQNAIDLKIEEVRQLDVLCIFKEINDLHEMELKNTKATKKWRKVELSFFGICILLGISILITLLVN